MNLKAEGVSACIGRGKDSIKWVRMPSFGLDSLFFPPFFLPCVTNFRPVQGVYIRAIPK